MSTQEHYQLSFDGNTIDYLLKNSQEKYYETIGEYVVPDDISDKQYGIEITFDEPLTDILIVAKAGIRQSSSSDYDARLYVSIGDNSTGSYIINGTQFPLDVTANPNSTIQIFFTRTHSGTFIVGCRKTQSESAFESAVPFEMRMYPDLDNDYSTVKYRAFTKVSLFPTYPGWGSHQWTPGSKFTVYGVKKIQ